MNNIIAGMFLGLGLLEGFRAGVAFFGDGPDSDWFDSAVNAVLFGGTSAIITVTS